MSAAIDAEHGLPYPQQETEVRRIGGCSDEHCITCGDTGVPGRVIAMDENAGLAMVDVEGEGMEIDVTLISDVKPGDTVLIHAGVAIGQLDSHDE